MKELERDIHTIDAEGKTPGRLATQVVNLLMGKHRASFTPNVDAGDHVQVMNAAKMTITGKKIDQKVYYRHTEYGEGLKITPLSRLWAKDPSDVLRRAVSRMLPKNSHRKERLKRFVVKN
jgi:large subunit ribosomal protein L13